MDSYEKIKNEAPMIFALSKAAEGYALARKSDEYFAKEQETIDAAKDLLARYPDIFAAYVVAANVMGTLTRTADKYAEEVDSSRFLRPFELAMDTMRMIVPFAAFSADEEYGANLLLGNLLPVVTMSCQYAERASLFGTEAFSDYFFKLLAMMKAAANNLRGINPSSPMLGAAIRILDGYESRGAEIADLSLEELPRQADVLTALYLGLLATHVDASQAQDFQEELSAYRDIKEKSEALVQQIEAGNPDGFQDNLFELMDETANMLDEDESLRTCSVVKDAYDKMIVAAKGYDKLFHRTTCTPVDLALLLMSMTVDTIMKNTDDRPAMRMLMDESCGALHEIDIFFKNSPAGDPEPTADVKSMIASLAYTAIKAYIRFEPDVKVPDDSIDVISAYIREGIEVADVEMKDFSDTLEAAVEIFDNLTGK